MMGLPLVYQSQIVAFTMLGAFGIYWFAKVLDCPRWMCLALACGFWVETLIHLFYGRDWAPREPK
jgi:hypothetical protein